MPQATRSMRLCAALALSLSACGGGGGGGGSVSTGGSSSISAIPGDATFSSFYTSPLSATLSASDSAGNTFSVQLSQTPNAGTTTFNGATVSSADRSVSLSRNGVLAATSSQTLYFKTSPFVPVGSARATSIPVAVVTSSTPVPATLAVGASGTLATTTYYHDASAAVLDATMNTTFSVSADTATTLLLCTTDVTSGVTTQGSSDGLANDTEVDCYHVNANGASTIATLSLTVGATTLTFK